MTGKHRPNLSSKTNTCCPTKGLPMPERQTDSRHSGIFEPVPEATDWRVTGGQMSKPCYRGLYGVTKNCKALVQIRIIECKDCKCLKTRSDGSKVKEYIKVDVTHSLTTHSDGCKPWFTLADSGLRAFISSVRKKAVDEKLKKCGY